MAAIARTPRPGHPPTVARSPVWGRVWMGVWALVAPGTAAWVHPMLGAVLAVIDVAVPAVLVVAAMSVAVFGTERASERVFRLLRWASNRPEPSSPAPRVHRALD